MRQSLHNVGQNVELANYTQALYDARELAMERMQAEALEAKAEDRSGVSGQRTATVGPTGTAARRFRRWGAMNLGQSIQSSSPDCREGRGLVPVCPRG
jgi:hypothetical protein